MMLTKDQRPCSLEGDSHLFDIAVVIWILKKIKTKQNKKQSVTATINAPSTIKNAKTTIAPRIS